MALTISQRAQNIAPSLTLAIDAKAKEMVSQGIDVISFGAGEPDFDTPVHIREAAKVALDKGYTRYTPVSGILPLRKAICDKFLRDNQLHYTPDEIIVSSGAKHSLFNILQCIIDPGDEVIIPSPCWVSYPELVKMAGGVPVFAKTTEENAFIPTEAVLKSCVSPKTKAIILTTPSNPCGSVLPKSALEIIAQLALDHHFFVISDEIYEKLLYTKEKHLSIASINEEIKNQTFIVNGVSKDYAMTGWRIGYTAGPKEVIKAMTCYQSQSTSNPNSIAQHASLAALTMDQSCVEEMVKAFKIRRDYITKRINQIEGLSCIKPDGAFYIMVNIQKLLGSSYKGNQIKDSTTFANLLLEQAQVAVVPGIAFEAEGYCRLSYAISLEKITLGLDRIEAFVKELSYSSQKLQELLETSA